MDLKLQKGKNGLAKEPAILPGTPLSFKRLGEFLASGGLPGGTAPEAIKASKSGA
jgi:hypothetical protein